ncbi:TIGR02757 family protein [Marivirga arenosa]|uniref:TIGR02757 family protein n=1 Tax=Marivirga arenosa TaxID=3059076 RepID=A0AA51ZVG9_9BACT|nr:TIGR02757 family protein [Marivirga sp. BKB1-2]WNB17492.1 TIGR02757 family protein [Marivirga sp. BKB1-2]
MNNIEEVKSLLDEKYDLYNRPDFIDEDPISIPHVFSKKQDIEIAGFFASILAWGQRKTIINKCKELMTMMGNSPHEFVLNHSETDLQSLMKFKHRTFNDTDTLYFIHFFKSFYQEHDSLEEAFLLGAKSEDEFMKNSLIAFHHYFFSSDIAPNRTRKHIATPERKSACKRINMYLRWMVRNDQRGVDFGIWNKIQTSDLICPCDLHVDRVARKLGLIQRKQTDWQTAQELTDALKDFDANDPVKYDFALFGLGIMEGFGK